MASCKSNDSYMMQSARAGAKHHLNGLALTTSNGSGTGLEHASWWGKVGDSPCSTPTFAKEGFSWGAEVPLEKEAIRRTRPYATEPEAEHPPRASPGAASPRKARSVS